MTTHDQHNEATPPLEQVEPATPVTDREAERADSSIAPTGPVKRTNRIDHSRSRIGGRPDGRRTAHAGSRFRYRIKPSQTKQACRPPIPNRRSQVPKQPAGWQIQPGLEPNHPLTDRFSPMTSFPNSARGGTMSRPASSTTPKTASRRRTAWCRMWSNSLQTASPRRVRASNNSGVAAKKRPPRIFESPLNATESSSTDYSRYEADKHLSVKQSS